MELLKPSRIFPLLTACWDRIAYAGGHVGACSAHQNLFVGTPWPRQPLDASRLKHPHNFQLYFWGATR
jgi:hypothetical protein